MPESAHTIFGLSPLAVATAVFVLTYAFIIADKINRAIVALLGALAVLGLRLISQEQAIDPHGPGHAADVRGLRHCT